MHGYAAFQLSSGRHSSNFGANGLAAASTGHTTTLGGGLQGAAFDRIPKDVLGALSIAISSELAAPRVMLPPPAGYQELISAIEAVRGASVHARLRALDVARPQKFSLRISLRLSLSLPLLSLSAVTHRHAR